LETRLVQIARQIEEVQAAFTIQKHQVIALVKAHLDTETQIESIVKLLNELNLLFAAEATIQAQIDEAKKSWLSDSGT
jgi:hypothetical protein